MRIKFNEVSIIAHKSLPCPKCHKRVKRQKKFWQTINPFNRIPDGTIKSREIIQDEITREAATWREKPELCSKCTCFYAEA